MEYAQWKDQTPFEKIAMLQAFLRELAEINKNIANPPEALYNNMRRRKILKNHIRDISAYMRDGYDDEKKPNEENSSNPRRH